MAALGWLRLERCRSRGQRPTVAKRIDICCLERSTRSLKANTAVSASWVSNAGSSHRSPAIDLRLSNEKMVLTGYWVC